MPEDLTPTRDELNVQPPKAGDDHTNEPGQANREAASNEGDGTQGS